MAGVPSYDMLEELGRARLSKHFFMRDFLYSEIAAWHGLHNVPDDPEQAIICGRHLCEQLLEPLQAAFGRIHVRSGYRSPTVNDLGNRSRLNCASNEKNYAAHIWDHPDARGYGAMACIVLPWLVDYGERGGKWSDMAWWIHDHLPYSTLCFFPRLAAFNIGWHERPLRRIDSYAEPKGCLTRSGMSNHNLGHQDEYASLSSAADVQLPLSERSPVPSQTTPSDLPLRAASPSHSPELPGRSRQVVAAAIRYRAVHSKTAWRKVNHHQTLEAALHGPSGAASLFAGTVRVDYAKHGTPLYVAVWQEGAPVGHIIKADAGALGGVRSVEVPMSRLLRFESQDGASHGDLEECFAPG